MNRRLAAVTEPIIFKLFRHAIPRGHTLSLERRRIYALPTRYGLLFAAMLLVMLLGSINYNNSLGFILTFLLASMGVISILHTYRNIARLQLRSGKTTPAFAGGKAHFTLHLYDPENQPRYALRLTAAGAASVTDIPAQNNAVLELGVTTQRRGRLALGKITLSTTYPLGLVRAWAYADLDMHAIVYPHPGPNRPLDSLAAFDYSDRSGTSMGSDDFMGFRDYHSGDSPHHIHWKALARNLPLLTKRFTASESPELWLDWSLLPALDDETRLRILCRLVLEAQRGGQSYGLRLPGVEIKPGQGTVHQHRCLERLALFGEARQ